MLVAVVIVPFPLHQISDAKSWTEKIPAWIGFLSESFARHLMVQHCTTLSGRSQFHARIHSKPHIRKVISGNLAQELGQVEARVTDQKGCPQDPGALLGHSYYDQMLLKTSHGYAERLATVVWMQIGASEVVSRLEASCSWDWMHDPLQASPASVGSINTSQIARLLTQTRQSSWTGS